MRKNRRYPLYSIKSKTKSLSLLLVATFLVFFIISFISITTIRKQNIDNISSSVDIYLDQIYLKLNAIEHFVIWSIKNETLLSEMEEAELIGDYIKYLNLFRSKVNDFQFSIGTEYQFFLYLDNEDFFINVSNLQIDYCSYKKIQDYFYRLLQYDKITFSTPRWKTLNVDNTYYLYHFYRYKNRAIICLTSVKDILKPLEEINLGSKGKIVIETDDGYYLTSTGAFHNKEYLQSNIFISNLDYHADDLLLPFSFHIYVDNLTSSERLLILFSAVLTITVTIVLVQVYILLLINNKIQKPIQTFINNLSHINDNDDFLNLQSSHIIELEQANQQFKNLMHQIKKLKINIYEKELEKERIQLDYLQLQINPHFYLNCLTTINSMAQTQSYEEIKLMTMSTIKYFRHLFQCHDDFVPLCSELENVSDYLSIQKIRLGDIFTYQSIIDDEVLNMAIPHLVLQTFIENTLKYGFLPDKKLVLYLICNIESNDSMKTLRLQILDNGPGYPAEVLDCLQKGLPLTSTDGTRIGITNVVKRLKLLYEDRFSIEFENMITGGASTNIYLPYIVYRTTEGKI